MSELQDNIRLAAQAINQASALLITAGAGMGVDSGLPDFRGNQGFWRAYPALKGYPFEEMANPKWFTSDPTRAWGFYGRSSQEVFQVGTWQDVKAQGGLYHSV